jgi:hypothetical protein
MQASETMVQADSTGTDGADGRVRLWADSVGEAARQLGVVLTFGIAIHIASNLLFGL